MDLEIYEPLIITNSLNDVKEENLDVQYHSEYGDESDEFLDFKLDEDILNLEKQEQDLTDLSDNEAILKKLRKQIQDLTDLKNNKSTLKKFKYQMQDLTDLKYNKTTLKKLKGHARDLTDLKDKKTTTTLKMLELDLTSIKNNKKTLRKFKNKTSNKVEKKTEAPSQKQTVVQNIKAARELRVVVERLKFTEDGKVVRPDQIKLFPKPKVNVPPPKRENYSWTMKRVEIKSAKKAKFGKTKKEYPQLHLNGYIYNRKAEGQSGTVYWKCWKKGCRSWVKQDGKRFVAPTKHELCVPFEYKKPKEPVKKIVHYCSFCEKSFGKKSTWIVHERTHTGEKPYVCDICNKRCAAAGTLISHRLTHNKEKPFKCQKCTYEAITSTNLKHHLRRHHPAKGQKARNCKQYAKR